MSLIEAGHSCLQQIEVLCRRRGVRLTPQRKRVLEIIMQHAQPLGAYEILEILGRSNGSIAPPTVYRALDFLLSQGLIHRIETLHAFVGCHHPGHEHTGQFLICHACGLVEELESDEINRSLQQAADKNGFSLEQPVIEITGLCAQCRN